MSQVVNLRRARKKKKRENKEREAAERRVQFGQTKPDRARWSKERDSECSRHEGHRLTNSSSDSSNADES